MIVVSRPLFRALLVAGLVASIFTGGCKKKPVATTPKQEAPAPAPAQPTVTLSAHPTSVNKGDPSTLTWTSTNSTQLTIPPDVATAPPEVPPNTPPPHSTPSH